MRPSARREQLMFKELILCQALSALEILIYFILLTTL